MDAELSSVSRSGPSLTCKLEARVCQKNELSPTFVHQMFGLYQRHYDKVCFQEFSEDLSKKDYAILLFAQEAHSSNSDLRGFSTLSVIEFEYKGRPLRAIFSGDTIIEKDFWGEQVLPYEWCRLAGVIKRQAPHIPLYWLLIVKGHRTYRLMTLFSKQHYPSCKVETPAYVKELMDFLGEYKFGAHYNSQLGLIQFPQSRGQLKPEFDKINDRYSQKPDVGFFLQKNPKYLEGEELLCLTELSSENLRSIALRGFSESKG